MIRYSRDVTFFTSTLARSLGSETAKCGLYEPGTFRTPGTGNIPDMDMGYWLPR
jgi:hypothetical protein